MNLVISKNGKIADYPELKRQVKETFILGQQRIEQEKVRTYWETGHLILNYLSNQKGKDKRNAEYGKKVIMNLAADLEMDRKVLYRAVGFAEKFPKFAARRISSNGLTWSHYRALITVPDERKRVELAERASRHKWDTRKLELAVKEGRQAQWKAEDEALEKEPPPAAKKALDLLTPKCGVLYTYRLVAADSLHTEALSILQIDLGFSSFLTAHMKKPAGLKAGDVVESRVLGEDRFQLVKAAGKTEDTLFTYKAYVTRVIDGDTLQVRVDLGFGISADQTLRLRGIDCPELDTPEGRRTKRSVETELKDVPYIIITSSKSDKYDRYLADVWRGKENETFLNNLLLEKGLAERMDD